MKMYKWCFYAGVKYVFFCLLEIQLKPVDLPGTLLRPLFKSQIIFPGTDTRQSTGVQWQCFSTAFLAVVHWLGGSVDPEATSLISGPARQLGSGAQPAVQSRGCNLCNLCSDTRDYNLPLALFSQPIAAARPGPARKGMATDKYNLMISVLLFGISTNDATATRRQKKKKKKSAF